MTLFLFTYHLCPYRFPYIDNTLIDWSRARTLLIRSNIVPTKIAADKLWPRIFLEAYFSAYCSVGQIHADNMKRYLNAVNASLINQKKEFRYIPVHAWCDPCFLSLFFTPNIKGRKNDTLCKSCVKWNVAFYKLIIQRTLESLGSVKWIVPEYINRLRRCLAK